MRGMRFGSSVLEAIENLLALIEDREGEDEEARQARQAQIPEVLSAIYEAVIGKYRPIAKVIPGLFERLWGDLVPLGLSVARVVAKTSDNPAVKELAEENLKRRAAKRFDTLHVYEKAGFTRDEAMHLMTIDILNLKSAISNGMDSLKRSSK